jgi:hypothetical protein
MLYRYIYSTENPLMQPFAEIIAFFCSYLETAPYAGAVSR